MQNTELFFSDTAGCQILKKNKTKQNKSCQNQRKKNISEFFIAFLSAFLTQNVFYEVYEYFVKIKN